MSRKSQTLEDASFDQSAASDDGELMIMTDHGEVRFSEYTGDFSDVQSDGSDEDACGY